MVDPRGLRFAASITCVVLGSVLLTSSLWLLAVQAGAHLAGALAGVRHAPYALLFRFLVRPRLGPAETTEDAAPPRFAQAVGAFFCALGLIGFGTGVGVLGYAATGIAFAAAFVNAAFNLCLGCHMYLTLRSITVRGAHA